MKGLALVIGTATLLFASSAGAQQVDTLRYSVQIDGLACPFCAFGLERKLKTLPGVDEVTVDLGQGRATFAVAEGSVVLPAAIRRAVRDAGFTTRQIGLTVRGRVSVSDGGLRITVGRSSLRLARGGRLDRLRSAVARAAGRFRLTGVVTRHGRDDRLRVQRFRRL